MFWLKLLSKLRRLEAPLEASKKNWSTPTQSQVEGAVAFEVRETCQGLPFKSMG